MRIGIEAKWYFDGPPSGKRVIKALVDNILALDSSENEYYIILNKKHKGKQFVNSRRSNVHVRYIWAGNNLLSNVFMVPAIIRKEKLDVILFQNFVSIWGARKAIAYIHDILFLSHPHFYTFIERLYFSPLKFLTKRANSVITVSYEEKERLIQHGFVKKTQKIFVVHHGVESCFRPIEKHSTNVINNVRHKYSLPEKYLLFVGRLNVRKNIDTLLRALKNIDKDYRLVIVGGEDWKSSSHIQTIEDENIKHRVLLTGALYGEELEVVYAMAYVFCFPSLAESFGLPALEAMASGVPVVVSNTTSLPEICGDAGNYVNPADPKSIANVINELITNKELYNEKRNLGLMIAKKFTWEQSARQLLNCIKETVTK